MDSTRTICIAPVLFNQRQVEEGQRLRGILDHEVMRTTVVFCPLMVVSRVNYSKISTDRTAKTVRRSTHGPETRISRGAFRFVGK